MPRCLSSLGRVGTGRRFAIRRAAARSAQGHVGLRRAFPQQEVSEGEAALHREELGDRPEDESGKERQRADDEDRPKPEAAEFDGIGPQGADGGRRVSALPPPSRQPPS